MEDVPGAPGAAQDAHANGAAPGASHGNTMPLKKRFHAEEVKAEAPKRARGADEGDAQAAPAAAAAPAGAADAGAAAEAGARAPQGDAAKPVAAPPAAVGACGACGAAPGAPTGCPLCSSASAAPAAQPQRAPAAAPPLPPRVSKPIYAPEAPRVLPQKPKAVPKPRKGAAAAAGDAPAAPAPAAPAAGGAGIAATGPDGVPKYGCPKCRYLDNGCAKCLRGPTVKTTWVPDAGCRMDDVPPVPSYHPTEAEWADPLAYVAKIRPEAEQYGICRIVPPPSWRPPFSLPNKETLRFPTRIQALHELQNRAPGAPTVTVRRPNGAGRMGGGGGAMGRMGGAPPAGGRMGGGRMGGGGMAPVACAAAGDAAVHAAAEGAAAAGADAAPALKPEAVEPAAAAPPAPDAPAGDGAAAADALAAAAEGAEASPPAPPPPPPEPEEPGSYGFRPGEKHTLATLEKYSRFFKMRYFATRAGKPKTDVSVAEVEAEFWRLVENKDPARGVEVVYGADIPTGDTGSGFPAAPDAAPGGSASAPEIAAAAAEAAEAAARYASAPWNVCNMPFQPASALRHVEKTTGISVPWLYFGMCLSAFCWHVEDHHFYSVNFHHWGDPKVWYSIPASASARFEAVMKAKLPHLFAAQPDLLHALVTLVSPKTLREAGVPVFRAVQEPGNYIITFPFAYHAGFNTGFNCAEATNFAPADWLPFGLDASERYSADKRYCSVAHDKMLLDLGRALAQPGTHPSLPPTAAAELDRRTVLEVKRRGEASLWAEREERMTEAEMEFCTENDCAVCLADLHISALFCECSPRAPTCLRHVSCACAPSRRRLAFRYTLDELRAAADSVRAVAAPDQLVMRPLEERFGPDGTSAPAPARPLASAAEAAVAFEAAKVEAAKAAKAAKAAAAAAAAEEAAAQAALAAAAPPAEPLPQAPMAMVH